MSIKALLVGLDPREEAAVGLALGQMHVQADVCDTPALARAAFQAGGYFLAVIGYEGEGCGLPLALSLRPHSRPTSGVDCIVVADQLCPALSKAAQDLGLWAVLVRPVTPKALATAIEVHIAKRAGASPEKVIT